MNASSHSFGECQQSLGPNHLHTHKPSKSHPSFWSSAFPTFPTSTDCPSSDHRFQRRSLTQILSQGTCGLECFEQAREYEKGRTASSSLHTICLFFWPALGHSSSAANGKSKPSYFALGCPPRRYHPGNWKPVFCTNIVVCCNKETH